MYFASAESKLGGLSSNHRPGGYRKRGGKAMGLVLTIFAANKYQMTKNVINKVSLSPRPFHHSLS